MTYQLSKNSWLKRLGIIGGMIVGALAVTEKIANSYQRRLEDEADKRAAVMLKNAGISLDGIPSFMANAEKK